MKPSWDDAPEWANYLAMDYDGEWFWFEFEPKLNSSGKVWARMSGRAKTAEICGDFHQESLEPRQ